MRSLYEKLQKRVNHPVAALCCDSGCNCNLKKGTFLPFFFLFLLILSLPRHLSSAPGIQELNWAKKLDIIIENEQRQDDFSFMANLHHRCFPYLFRLLTEEQWLFETFSKGQFKNPGIRKRIEFIRWVLEKLNGIQNILNRRAIKMAHKIKYHRYSLDGSWPKMSEVLGILTREQKSIIKDFERLVTAYWVSMKTQDLEIETILRLQENITLYVTSYNKARTRFLKLFKDYNFSNIYVEWRR